MSQSVLIKIKDGSYVESRLYKVADNVYAPMMRPYSPRSTAYEEITVDNTVKKLSEGTYKNAEAAKIDVRGYALRYRTDAMATAVIPAALFALMVNDVSTVQVENHVFTKVESGAEDGEFTNAAGLAGLINALDKWTATEGDGNVTVVSDGFNDDYIGYAIPTVIEAGETENGATGTPSSFALLEAFFTAMANGDTVEFDGNTYTKSGSNSVANKTFANQAGLAACINALTDWGAAATDDVTITAAENGDDWDGYPVVVTYFKATALSDPSTTVGHLVSANEVIELKHPDDIKNFRAIRTTGDSAQVFVTYFL